MRPRSHQRPKTGVEPATIALQERRSAGLSYFGEEPTPVARVARATPSQTGGAGFAADAGSAFRYIDPSNGDGWI